MAIEHATLLLDSIEMHDQTEQLAYLSDNARIVITNSTFLNATSRVIIGMMNSNSNSNKCNSYDFSRC